MRFRMRPKSVDAWQFDGSRDSAKGIKAALGDDAGLFADGSIMVKTMAGFKTMDPGQWVVRYDSWIGIVNEESFSDQFENIPENEATLVCTCSDGKRNPLCPIHS